MKNKEFKELMLLYKKLRNMFEEFEDYFINPEEDKLTPIFLPDDIYQEICITIKQDEITLLGIS